MKLKLTEEEVSKIVMDHLKYKFPGYEVEGKVRIHSYELEAEFKLIEQKAESKLIEQKIEPDVTTEDIDPFE